MPLAQRGFSLIEVLIAMAIGSILLLSTARFLPGLQQALLRQQKQQEREEEVWLRLTSIGKSLQRAGYCEGACQGLGAIIGQEGHCVIVQWDANSNGRWEDSPPAQAEQTGFRISAGALETGRGITSCEGKGWEKLTDPDTLQVNHFKVSRTQRDGYSPEFIIELDASPVNQPGASFHAVHHVTGFNL